MDLNRDQIHGIIFYNFKRVLSRNECLQKMNQMLVSNALSLPTIKCWYTEFRCGCESLEGELKDSRFMSATTDDMVQKVCKINEEDPK